MIFHEYDAFADKKLDASVSPKKVLGKGSPPKNSETSTIYPQK